MCQKMIPDFSERLEVLRAEVAAACKLHQLTRTEFWRVSSARRGEWSKEMRNVAIKQDITRRTPVIAANGVIPKDRAPASSAMFTRMDMHDIVRQLRIELDAVSARILVLDERAASCRTETGSSPRRVTEAIPINHPRRTSVHW
jgi:hypothetical protein